MGSSEIIAFKTYSNRASPDFRADLALRSREIKAVVVVRILKVFYVLWCRGPTVAVNSILRGYAVFISTQYEEVQSRMRAIGVREKLRKLSPNKDLNEIVFIVTNLLHYTIDIIADKKERLDAANIFLLAGKRHCNFKESSMHIHIRKELHGSES